MTPRACEAPDCSCRKVARSSVTGRFVRLRYALRIAEARRRALGLNVKPRTTVRTIRRRKETP